ncbi:cilia- and flagella-associated protein 337-like [Leuresthes tenuis]|uniref:cilia- and flagella-associated protein 337-like n=1 Tax=Leuresthes tenuis TaxID=355514 RepID=UPI003B510E03
MGTRMEVAQLESRMNTKDYKRLQSLFLDSSGAARSLSKAEFIDLAWTSVGLGSKEEYGLLFDGVVVTQEHRGLLLGTDGLKEDGRIDWRGLCSFLLLELSDKVKHSRAIGGPRWKSPRTLTCPHRDAVQKVLYLQSSSQYLTVSKGGTVVLRDGEDLSILRTHRLQNSTVTPKDLWVTDLVVLHNVHKIAVAFTCKEVCFYDTLSEQDFSCKFKLQGLRFVPWCLDYWTDPSHPDQAVLTIGDVGGQVSALVFTSVQISLFDRLSLRSDSDTQDIILWDELVKGKHCSCYVLTHQAHAPAWVRKVYYLGSLEAFVSCSTRPQSSMAIGWIEKESRSLRVTTYATKKGVWDVDYHCQLNLIATAGVDHQVLLWNPFVTSGLVFALTGHSNPVTAVHFMRTKQQLLSYSKDKVLCLWDVSNQVCIHRLAGVFPKTQEDTRTLLFLQEEQQHLLLSFNSQLLLLETMKEEKRTSSHEHPVTCVLYNSLFRQVVSSDSASSVICWLADTGQKVKQFDRCHGNSEISTMALDGTQTRLFTAGADGEVKVWDFNGRCLHRMKAGLGRPVVILKVLLLRRSILVMGWKRMLTVFHLHSFSRSIVEPSEWKGGVQHRGDILCAAFQPPQTLVTESCLTNPPSTTTAYTSDNPRFVRVAKDETEVLQEKVFCTRMLSSPVRRVSKHEISYIICTEILCMKATVLRQFLTSCHFLFVLPLMCAGSYDGEIIVWNSSTEKAVKKLQQHDDHKDYKKQQENCTAITKLFFIPGRTSAAKSKGCADLVSCGGLGVIRLWNIQHSHLVGQFTAHNGDLGSIVMTVSPCGKYLVTADRGGTVKTWDIEHYCLKPEEGLNKGLPKLLHSFHPHLDYVTHLEIFIHGNRLLLLSSSSDCRIALSYLPGETVGLFGQEGLWSLERPHPGRNPGWDQSSYRGQEDTRSEGKRSPSILGETDVEPGLNAAQGEREAGI